jgi:hypothetical protein
MEIPYVLVVQELSGRRILADQRICDASLFRFVELAASGDIGRN